jgi:hypothetical protein
MFYNYEEILKKVKSIPNDQELGEYFRSNKSDLGFLLTFSEISITPNDQDLGALIRSRISIK